MMWKKIGLELFSEIREPRPDGSYNGPLTELELLKVYEIHFLLKATEPVWVAPLVLTLNETSGKNGKAGIPGTVGMFNVYAGPGFSNWGKAYLNLPLYVPPSIQGTYICYNWRLDLEAKYDWMKYRFKPCRWSIPLTIVPTRQEVGRDEPYLPWTSWREDRPGGSSPILNLLRHL